MLTLCGFGRRLQLRAPHRPSSGEPVLPEVSSRAPGSPHEGRVVAAGSRPLVTDDPGDQRRAGVLLDQADATTCGSAVLVALATWAGPAELGRLDGAGPGGFEAAFDERQRVVHRQSTRCWPRPLGTTPWGMLAWLRRHARGVGPYRVRLVDDTDTVDLTDVIATVDGALARGLPVPLMVGSWLPRHYVLAVSLGPDGWRVYEPSSGQVRAVDPLAVTGHTLARQLGFDRLHAALTPV